MHARRAILPLALVLAGSMWFYVQHVMIPHQQVEAAKFDIPRGNLSDLYPRWLGARELLLHHRDPYSADVTREIQIGYYRRPLDLTRPHDPKDQQGFAYPVHVAFLLAPTVQLPFETVQIGFRWLLITLTAVSVLLWLRVLSWHLSCANIAALIVLTIGSFQVLQGIKLQQLSLLVSALIAVAVFCLVKDRLLLAGALLALATIKPQLVLLLAAWLLLWAIGDWRQRQRFAWSFGLSMAALLAASEMLLPGWFGEFRTALVAYREYNDGAWSILDTLLSPGAGRMLSAVILLTLAVLAWRIRAVDAHSTAFQFTTAFVLTLTVVVMPKAAPYNQILLAPGIFFLIQHSASLWTRNRLMRATLLLAAAFLLWPWMAALGLTLASLVLPAETVQQALALPLYTSLAIPIGVAAALAIGATGVVTMAESPHRPSLHSTRDPR